MAQDQEGVVEMPLNDAINQFYVALNKTHTTLQNGIDKLGDKIDDIRSSMPTHRDLEELKSRLSKNEATIDLLRDETVRRREVEQSLKSLQESQKELNGRLDKVCEKIEAIIVARGRAQPWVWPTIIASAVALLGVFFRGH